MPSKKSSKRSLPFEDLPSPKRVQTRSSLPGSAFPPTPNDPRSTVNSAAPSRSPSVEVVGRVPPSPPCPGIVRECDQSALSRIPHDFDVLDTFARLRVDNDLSDEEAFLKFIATYDVPLSTLSQIAVARLPTSFSNVKYKEMAPYAWLDPTALGRDILPLDTFQSRIPKDMFLNICKDVDRALAQYGRMASHDNEEARSRFLASIFTEIVSLFGNTVVNKPEALLDAEFTKRGRIEHHFVAMDSVSIVFIEVKKLLVSGTGKLDIIAQVLAESSVCNYVNLKVRHWVPILLILCDGYDFEFLVYDSGIKSVYSSGFVTGLWDKVGQPKRFLESLKETAEYIFDYFIMAYINGLRSFGHKSNLAAARSKSKKRASTGKWMDALARAEHAHFLVRNAAVLAKNGKLQQAEESATRGISELKESVLQVPGNTSEKVLESCYDGSECVETVTKRI